MSSEEIINKIQNNFSRHIAKALSSMDIGEVNSRIKSDVKSEFWNACDDVLDILGLRKVSQGEPINEVEPKN